ncbi:MAG TPA: hypothetical protein VHC01_04965 [Gaiellaceae bacterium]|nr:hypothetical protein [Gaiellaceae bacterium]
MRAALSVLLAFVASSLYAVSTSTQALDARETPRSTALRASLIVRLLRRPRWLLGTAAGAVAWPVQLAALSLGSVALVQPALGFGLVVLLVLGAAMLHERVTPRDATGVVAIAAAVGVLGWAAPADTGGFGARATWVVGLSLAVIGPGPYLLRAAGRDGGLATSIGAGLGWAWVGLGSSLVDDALAARHWLGALLWALGVAVASWAALLAEMTALQAWPATRAIPIAFGLEMLLPAALAPLLTTARPPHAAAFGLALAAAAAGVAVLGTSRAVAHAAHPLPAS